MTRKYHLSFCCALNNKGSFPLRISLVNFLWICSHLLKKSSMENFICLCSGNKKWLMMDHAVHITIYYLCANSGRILPFWWRETSGYAGVLLYGFYLKKYQHFHFHYHTKRIWLFCGSSQRSTDKPLLKYLTGKWDFLMPESITRIVKKAKSLYLRFDLDCVAAISHLTKNSAQCYQSNCCIWNCTTISKTLVKISPENGN